MHIFSFRADIVHAGCLLDPTGCSGFRVHMCLPLTAYHLGCGDAKAIEWKLRDKLRKRYSKYLRRENGSSFDIDPKSGQFCYAKDILKQFPEQTSYHRSLSTIDDETVKRMAL